MNTKEQDEHKSLKKKGHVDKIHSRKRKPLLGTYSGEGGATERAGEQDHSDAGGTGWRSSGALFCPGSTGRSGTTGPYP